MGAEHGQQPRSGGRRGPGSGNKKSKKHSQCKETYLTYTYKVLKQVRPEIGISSKATSIMNSFVNNVFARLAGKAARGPALGPEHPDDPGGQGGATSAAAWRAGQARVPGGTEAVPRYTSSK
ncbi:unnamed protein product [Nyctereutes procyonoides]|uniref:(raccoon dog) hypothetical protein n=1 Tax=Nyctereutes procyonoides TaxID=34880 RepID=A0A811ZNC8_NYCPR|nr:histone H2B type 2-K1-like [Nyctereutes procyonoides]CAD7690195.1 unnamed protein product [Nyctereutes procyonoides]